MKKVCSLLIGVVVFLSIIILLCLSLPKNGLIVNYLDVGQGDAIFIRSPDDFGILIDAGPDTTVLEELEEVMPPYNRTIDLIILSHPHADHVNGFVEVVKRYKIKNALIVGTPSGNQYYQEFLRILTENKVPVHFACASRDIKIGKDLFIDVIWPEHIMAGVKYENLNNASLSFRLIYRNHTLLFTGDAETEQENEIINSGFEISADVLKAGHHGSRTASSETFLNKVMPRTVVIQSGSGNSYKHPHKETLSALMKSNIEILRNDISGRISLEFF